MKHPTLLHKAGFFTLDLLVVAAGFLVAFRLRLGTWNILEYKEGLGPAFAMSVLIYGIALLLSGLYRVHASEVHLKTVLNVAIALSVAWAVSILVTFLSLPRRLPPRSVSAVHFMFSLIGVVGLRGLYRQFFESLRPGGQTILRIPTPSISEVLSVSPVEIEKSAIQRYLSGRTVLVTGAAGSIGSVLTKLLVELKPLRLVLVDVSEYFLFQLEETIRKYPFGPDLVFRIADVRDEDIMQSVFEEIRPDIIFHAAAYKHVPLMERHPVEAFRNNTLSTVSLVRLSEQFGAEQFIFVSTDKVVEPSSVLGATKRLGEWYVQAAQSDIQRKIVRFGNVFGSQGSVVELFAGQIASGGPIRVTHPDMERYFMSAEDACSLILQTLVFEDDLSTYMLRMGKPVNIVWLARRMIELYAPAGSKIDIEYTGVRPGEKLKEQLHAEFEKPRPTSNPSIVALSFPTPFSRSELDDHIEYLVSLSAQNRPAELRRALFEKSFPKFADS